MSRSCTFRSTPLSRSSILMFSWKILMLLLMKVLMLLLTMKGSCPSWILRLTQACPAQASRWRWAYKPDFHRCLNFWTKVSSSVRFILFFYFWNNSGFCSPRWNDCCSPKLYSISCIHCYWLLKSVSIFSIQHVCWCIYFVRTFSWLLHFIYLIPDIIIASFQ